MRKPPNRVPDVTAAVAARAAGGIVAVAPTASPTGTVALAPTASPTGRQAILRAPDGGLFSVTAA
ncbi:hypothetical protein ACFWMG_42140 [Streptomyces sp. NPDC127074]|uniref:hypothetical protein n=1 Tax=Streptomyces sp. NPDC127074 TaxID=3347130 RepID=UPI00364FBA5A